MNPLTKPYVTWPLRLSHGLSLLLIIAISSCGKQPAETATSLATDSAPPEIAANYGADQFLDVDEAFKVDIHPLGSGFELVWTIAPDYYLYKRKFEVLLGDKPESPHQDLTQLTQFSKGLEKTDDYFGRVEVFYHQAIARIEDANWPGDSPSRDIIVKYQGCAESGLCYPVQTRVLSLTTAQMDSNSLPVVTEFSAPAKLH